jgi:hypothetical protein
MPYVAYWLLTDNGWSPSRVFHLDDQGRVVPHEWRPIALDQEGWQVAQNQVRLRPEDRKFTEVSKPEADLLSAEISTAGTRSIGNLYNFVPDAYLNIRGTPPEDEVAYVRIRKVLGQKRYLVDLLGVDTSYQGDLLDILFKEDESGMPRRVEKASDLELGREYVLQWSYEMMTTPKKGVQYLREEGSPEWRHQPDLLLDI